MRHDPRDTPLRGFARSGASRKDFDAARRAMSRIGSRIVVSAGDSRDATGLSSNPTTDNSSGITIFSR